MLPISEMTIRAFEEVWRQYDPEATKFIPIEKFEYLLIDLAAHEEGAQLLTMPELVKDDKSRGKLIRSLEIPTFDNCTKLNFYDTLAMLCNQVVQAGHKNKKM